MVKKETTIKYFKIVFSYYISYHQIINYKTKFLILERQFYGCTSNVFGSNSDNYRQNVNIHFDALFSLANLTPCCDYHENHFSKK